LSPVVTAKRAPLAAIWLIKLAWLGLVPSAAVLPQSPNTSNVNGAVDPAGRFDRKVGAGSSPSRSTCELAPK
jgi:hypothetical protein